MGRVGRICTTAEREVTSALAPKILAIHERLRGPLRIAVVGRVSSGKSTVVNAVLGKHVAATDEGECTRLVTWYRYGVPERVQVVLRDGSSRDLRLAANGALPVEIGADPKDVREVNAWLALDSLRSITLIDTPGLASVNADNSTATEHLLGLDPGYSDASASAEAVIFLLNQTVKADDAGTLEAFHRLSAGTGASALNAIGVLNKADLFGGADPWAVATELSAQHARHLAGHVSMVLPLAGLIAESAATGAVTEADAADLARLADSDPQTQGRSLLSGDRFMTTDSTLSEQSRRRLLALLGIHGLKLSLSLIGSGVTGAVALRRQLDEASGMPALRTGIRQTFAQRGEILKVDFALAGLERVAYNPDASPALRSSLLDQIEEVRLDPRMHELQELRAVEYLRSGEVRLPASLQEELLHMTTQRDPVRRLSADGASGSQLVDLALAGAARWSTYSFAAQTPRQVQVAEIMKRSYQLLLGQVAQDIPSTSRDV